MPIVNPDGTVTRSGQLLLEQLQPPGTIQGTHAARPDPSGAPDGAIYVESDRGVIYCNEGGVWQYIAGTMYALLNPDQRPTDLGVNDAGFEFRSIDTDPNYAPRQFLWSQSEWIETTMVLYGTHALRPPANEQTPARTIYVESDRGALYQHQFGFWQYIAGTMWGTLVPDQRPTDLGTHDAGFDFRTTDAPPREFIWSQTAWVETTPVGGAAALTHPNVVTKVGAAGQIVEGGITDLSAGNSGKVNITAAGRVGIQTASPVSALDVESIDSGGVTTLKWLGSDAAGITILQALSNANFRFYVRANGQTTVLGSLGVGGDATHALQLATDDAAKPSTNTWTIASDMRTKRNVSRFEGDIDVIRKLEPIVAEYNGKAGTPEGARVVSFDAAKLRRIIPPAVSSVRGKLNPDDSEETDLLGVNTHEIFFHMLRAIQYLDRQIVDLKRGLTG